MQITRKQLMIILAVTIIATVLVASPIVYVIAASPSRTLTIGGGQYPGAPSYSIYPYSGTYFAKDQNGYEEFYGTDASDVINDAVDAVADYGVIHLSGNLLLTSSIEVDKPLTLEGNAYLHVGNSFDSHIIHVTGDNVTIKGLRLNGNQDGQTLGGWGIWVQVVSGLYVDGVTVDNTWSGGIHIENSHNFTVVNSVFNHNAGVGISIANRATGVEDSYNFLISNNQCYDNEYGGIDVSYWQIGECYAGTVSNNVVDGDWGDGAAITLEYNVHNITVSGNSLSNCYRGGVYLVDAENNIVSSNIIKNCYQGLRMQTDCYNNSFVSNEVSGSYTGIQLYLTCDYNNVVGNFVEASHYALNIDGVSYNTFTGCVFYGSDIGIYEKNAADYNSFVGCKGVGTINISYVGANTHFVGCWNGTSWVDSV